MPRVISHQNSRICNYPWPIPGDTCHFTNSLTQCIFAEFNEFKSVRLDTGRCEELVAYVSIRQTYFWKNCGSSSCIHMVENGKPAPQIYMCLITVIYRNCKPFRDEKHVLVIIHSFSSYGRAPSSSWQLRVKKGDETPALQQLREATVSVHGAGEICRLHELWEENGAGAGRQRIVWLTFTPDREPEINQ